MITQIHRTDSNFPRRLRRIGDDCPEVIYCRGNLDLLRQHNRVAIIGARAADDEGCGAAYRLGQVWARYGYVVVSGLALGCDTAAHRGCLDEGGKTIAIVASGLDICHPKENKALEQEIIDKGGLIISEQPLGVKANPTRLVARNRLQAALSNIVILAQSPSTGGSMYTIDFARRYGKRIQAVKFDHESEINGGNFLLLNHGIAVGAPMVLDRLGPTEMRSRGLAHEAFNSVKEQMLADVDHILATPEFASAVMPPFHSAATREEVKLGAYLSWWRDHGCEPCAKDPIQWGEYLYSCNRTFPTIPSPTNIREIFNIYSNEKHT